ncbi:Alpha-acetolactate decarboxylase [Aspergillus sclerotialis]|uniref:Alpha-acetolactate decarboxylase n=1 Tax=Aspergillus sclerotialis TaxID=2070753 RepID=A0A3A3A381_9EURO|nr:Alpha-acetolactate decarboxylase [Aspergillus sclerotialis]
MATEFNHLYQYSVLSAFMQGLAEEGKPVGEILAQADHGIGTVPNINGEVIIIDGEGYYFSLDNNELQKMQPTDFMPFVMATRFKPTIVNEARPLRMELLSESLRPLLPLRQNNFLSIRIDATFRQIKYNIISPQRQPRESLRDLLARREAREAKNIKAVMFGFWSPPFTNAFTIDGMHLHFVSDDRRTGGHVMDFCAENATLSAAAILEYHVQLPSSEAFNEVPIEAHSVGKTL